MAAPVQRLSTDLKLTPEKMAKFFDVDSISARPDAKKLVDQIRDVVRDGIDRNRRDYRLYKAMDWSYDSPFYQISYTQLQGLLSRKPDDKKVMETINSWGLTHLLPDLLGDDGKPCCGKDGKRLKQLNLPVFFNIFVPIVMAYITIRWAKLFNDRNAVPLYPYEPVQFTRENRFRCEVLTQIVQKQSSWFGYSDDLKQSILQTLMYGFCINFPREAWFVEKQEDESGQEKIVREGLRFNMPHPSRIYYDLYHRLSTLNNNSGCEYAGYWELCRYKDIASNKLYWNKDKISIGAVSWFDIGRSDFLDEVFPCTMSFPDPNNLRGGTAGTGALDRESEAYRSYGQGDFNSATLLTQHFQKIIPAEYGLCDYKHPVWFRFVFASDNAVVWAEPLAYDRFPVYAYDADFNRARFRSLALEIMPYQDHIGNLLTHWILAVKENLVNPIFYDKEKVPTNFIVQMQNLGQKQFNGRPFIPYASTENLRFRADQREAFYTPQMSTHDTSQIASLIAGVLDMLDRVMQLSPQEIGQAASHEQTAEEQKIIERNTSNRVQFTGSFIDAADHAKKVMIYDATMAYADEDITVGIGSSLVNSEEEFKNMLNKVGFTVSDKAPFDPSNPDAVYMVNGKKSSLAMEQFASMRSSLNRIDNPALADAMSKIFLAMANNPVLIQSVGARQLIELLNQIIVVAGLPKEFRLKGANIDVNAPQEEQGQAAQQMLTGFAEQVKQAIEQSQQQVLQAAAQQTEQMVSQAASAIGEQMTPVVEAVAQTRQENQVQSQQIQQLADAVAQLNQIISAAAQAPPAPSVVPTQAPVPVGQPA